MIISINEGFLTLDCAGSDGNGIHDTVYIVHVGVHTDSVFTHIYLLVLQCTGCIIYTEYQTSFKKDLPSVALLQFFQAWRYIMYIVHYGRVIFDG